MSTRTTRHLTGFGIMLLIGTVAACAKGQGPTTPARVRAAMEPVPIVSARPLTKVGMEAPHTPPGMKAVVALDACSKALKTRKIYVNMARVAVTGPHAAKMKAFVAEQLRAAMQKNATVHLGASACGKGPTQTQLTAARIPGIAFQTTLKLKAEGANKIAASLSVVVTTFPGLAIKAQTSVDASLAEAPNLENAQRLTEALITNLLGDINKLVLRTQTRGY